MTKPAPRKHRGGIVGLLLTCWLAFWRQTIWYRHAIPLAEWKYRGLKRIVLPLVDVFLVYSGSQAIAWGAPSIGILYDKWVMDIYSISFTVAAGIALLAVIIPAAWLIELLSKTALVGLLSTYTLTLFFLSSQGSEARNFISGICAALCTVLIWRMILIGSEWSTRRETHKAETGGLRVS